jgi:predicted nuclease of predicted toxin-antitoxin system
MRLLIDENLSPRAARLLREAGHDAAHVTDVGLGNTDDAEILDAATDDARAIVTADTDFGALLAARGTSSPSVVMLRSSDHLTPDEQARLIVTVLARVGDELEQGAIASVTTERVRLRNLPLVPDGSTNPSERPQ